MQATHRVRQGESLYAIARKHHTTVEALQAANGIADPNLIQAGATLRIVPPPTAAVAVAPDQATLERPRGNALSQLGLPAGPPTQASPPLPDTDARPAQPPSVAAGARAPAQADAAEETQANLSPADKEALVRAIAAEARGETPAVWAAMAQTIINYARFKGESIPQLVRSSYLSSNHDGNRVYYQMPLDRIPNREGIEAAVEQGARGDSAVGEKHIFFHDTSISTPWYGTQPVRLGRMVFYAPKPGVQV
ncbi:MAG: LysM peptidoglycan-binding domain-containing protein [Candidatus Sericytochromatia bacterium]|nr:LysM peptidoglycan-binding domain-containing protein [Candidatus Sericytochromatia bacterium]